MKILILLLLSLLTGLWLTGCLRPVPLPYATAPAPEVAAYPLNARVPLHIDNLYLPRVAQVEGGTYLVYELHVTNFHLQPVALHGVEVRADTVGHQVLHRVVGTAFARTFKRVGLSGEGDSLRLPTGHRGIVFLWVKVPPTAPVPARLFHRLLVEANGRKFALAAPTLAVPPHRPVRLSHPPLQGRWLTGQGADPAVRSAEGHNRLLYPYQGSLRVPQRFASDWVQLGENHKLYRGDSTVNQNYFGFGAPVYAVAAGVVAATQNDVPENVPPHMTEPRTAKNVTGNFVLLHLRNGKSAYYGHLQTGSVRVRVGQRVKAGDLLARVGNTGNSTGPHLHFQVQDGPGMFDEGYPFTFRSYRNHGQLSPAEVDALADEGRAYVPRPRPADVTNALPLYGALVEWK